MGCSNQKQSFCLDRDIFVTFKSHIKNAPGLCLDLGSATVMSFQAFDPCWILGGPGVLSPPPLFISFCNVSLSRVCTHPESLPQPLRALRRASSSLIGEHPSARKTSCSAFPSFWLGFAHQALSTHFWGCSVRCAAARGARTALPVPCSVQRYISAEGQSLRSAKEFLLRQSRSLRQQRSALRAASLQWHRDLHRAQEAVQDPNSSKLLQGMHRNLEEVSPGC